MVQHSLWTAGPVAGSTESTTSSVIVASQWRLLVDAIDLAYVERGVHEELVDQLADREGYFEDEGVRHPRRDTPGP